MPIYMKYGDFKGSVTSANFKEQIELFSFSFGTARSIRFSDGRSKDRSADQPMVQEITISKAMDAASPKLFTESLKGEGQSVDITIAAMIKDQVTEVAKYSLENTIISSYSVGGGGGDMPSETITLNFTKVSFTFKSYDEKLTPKPETVSYDLSQAKTG